MSATSENAIARLGMSGIGAIAGLAVWALLDLLPDLVGNDRWVLALASLGLGFFGVLLALLGPPRPGRAAAAAALLSLAATALFVWASFRYASVEDFLGSGLHITSLVVLISIPVPFIAAVLERPQGWRDYAALFDLSWTIVVRYVAAWLFVGVVWAVVMLSDALLGLVGIHVIEDLLDVDPVPWLLSGLALGMGLAIVHELRDYVSPFLIIQLLRVLLPVLLVVLSVFILALPLRGLSGLFGTLSAAATLAGVTLAAITLITSAIHRDDDTVVDSRAMVLATQALAVMLPVPAGLALWSVWLRVGQYGLTPDRVAGFVATGLVLSYAVAYAASVLLRHDWAGRIRTVNRALALMVVAIAALWLTPALNAERLSVSSQIARAERGVPPEHLGLWEMAHAWGHAGKAGLERLRALDDHPARDTLLAMLDRAEAAESLWAFNSPQISDDLLSLAARVPVLPEGAALHDGALDLLRPADRRLVADACQRRLPGGHPGCLIVLGRFEPLAEVEQAIGLFLTEGDRGRAMAFAIRDGRLYRTGNVAELGAGRPVQVSPQMMVDLFEGRFEIRPAPRNVLDVGGMQLFPEN